MSLFDDIDLGADDYSGDKQNSLNQFTSKPVQRKYQPFGGPMPQATQQVQPPVDPQVNSQPAFQNVFEDEYLDSYDRGKKQLQYLNSDVSAFNSSASMAKKRYEDFRDNKFMPFFKSLNPIDEFENEDDYFRNLDELYKKTLKTSQQEDGFFGESDEKKLARQALSQFSQWNAPNGLRDQYRKLKAERDQKTEMADFYRQEQDKLRNQLTSIPMQTRMAMDEQLKNRSRSSTPRSKKATDESVSYTHLPLPTTPYV